ncbi:MAG TPA: alkaline phosphatase PhoX [Pyrinomonadaceae bacterium]|nr:alkaline phosphatase PhoX [Pyrinomonadaceae bacterium]
MATIGRREFIFGAGVAGAGVLAFHAFSRRFELLRTSGGSDSFLKATGFGPLSAAKSKNTGESLLSLPPGFEYTVFGKTGRVMSDGRPTPRAHDGMAAFDVDGELRLVRNHEVNNPVGTAGSAIGANPYDDRAGGGTTTLIIDPTTRELVRDFVSLSGTLINCAGGPTPWNSWISCEETVLGPESFRKLTGQAQGGFAQHHGYCFEVPAAANEPVAAIPLKAMGRFVHEAIAVDPDSGILYLTEDYGTCGFYRFLPEKQGNLIAGGRLQMLAIKDRARYDTRTGQKEETDLDVTWVDIARPDPPEAERDALAVYKQGVAGGAATFARLEGCWSGDGRIYFSSTSGGDRRLGQIWQYKPTSNKEGVLTLLFESRDRNILHMPDNMCVSPNGELIICEDNGVAPHVRVLTKEGRVYDLVKNIIPGFESREFAGATFSPDGKTLFVNVQNPGLTFAIWGAWES